MPKATTPRHPFQHHFSPYVLNAVFGPEKRFPPPNHPLRQVYDAETTPWSPPAPSLIPRPSGPTGRLSRGGFSLHQELKWDESRYEAVKSIVKGLSEEHLRPDLSYTLQDEPSLQQVCEALLDCFSFLHGYEKDWVVEEFIKAKLHNPKEIKSKNKENEAKPASLSSRPSRATQVSK
ncbi:hypothetical protein EWM64_g3814 [Hericium alpestre]|uniref:Uncharacterized protein n=1 Tax=Hericium alpestre TaxID=135208 RepID=A0A4Z0A1M7_9AGAM|nr:hypothetical protein EWM64_g3814 [Hericium alpestre]